MNNAATWCRSSTSGTSLDHLAMLVFPTVVIALAREWEQSVLGAAAARARRLHRLRRLRAARGLARRPLEPLQDDGGVLLRHRRGAVPHRLRRNRRGRSASACTVIGMFAAIYHPVGIAMLVAAPKKLGARARLERPVGQPRPRRRGADLRRADGLRSAGAPRSSCRASLCDRRRRRFPRAGARPGPGEEEVEDHRPARRPRAPWRASSPSC